MPLRKPASTFTGGFELAAKQEQPGRATEGNSPGARPGCLSALLVGAGEEKTQRAAPQVVVPERTALPEERAAKEILPQIQLPAAIQDCSEGERSDSPGRDLQGSLGNGCLQARAAAPALDLRGTGGRGLS